MTKFNRILAVGAHPEDVELGCGASLARFIDEGSTVYYVAFSMAKEAVKEPWPKNIMELEAKSAMSHFGIPPEKTILHDYKLRELEYMRQDILDELVKIKNAVKPDLVFLPCSHDTHQDHATVSIEGIRAFRESTVFGYELPWNNRTFSGQVFISISGNNLRVKLEALNMYESQRYRIYLDQEFIMSLARVRGLQARVQYAEAFEAVRLIL